MRFLAVPLRLYEREGDMRALEIARDLILDWIRGNPLDGETTGDFAWTDCAGHRALFFSYTRRECIRNGILDPAHDDILTTSLREHATWLTDAENYSGASNHGLYQDGGLFLLAAYAPDLPESAGWRSVGESRFLSTLKHHVEWDEGLHKEHSPSYHMYVRELVINLHEGAGLGGEYLDGLVEKLDVGAGWLVLPNNHLLPFGDTDIAQKAPDFARKRACATRGIGAFLRTGYAIVREGDSYLGVTCSYHTHAHKHADELSWCLYEKDKLLVGDSSRYGYRDEKDPARIYARSSRGHNVLIVDDQAGQKWQGTVPYGSGLIGVGHGDGWYAILGCNPLLKGVSHRRLLVYRPGELLIVVDQVQAEDEHEILRRLHFGPEIETEFVRGTVVARSDGNEVAKLINSSAVPTQSSVARGVDEPELDGWTFPRNLLKIPCDTVTLRNRMSGGVLIHGLAMSPLTPPDATAEVTDDTFMLNLSAGGLATQIEVALSGEKLHVHDHSATS
jgi:Heparinase II/III-like protein/Heparinase II/III N-terminus